MRRENGLGQIQSGRLVQDPSFYGNGIREKAGVRAKVEVVPEDEWMSLRKSGQLACYAATWTADYNDPDKG